MSEEKIIRLLLVIIATSFSIISSDGAKILASVFTPSYSHQVAFRPLWKELDKRGHHIVLITTDPMNDKSLKNIKEIDVHMSYDVINRFNGTKILSRTGKEDSILEKMNIYLKALHDTSLAQLEHPEVQKLIHNKTEHFDILMIEVAHPTHVGFVERWKVPLIGLVSLDAASQYHEAMGNTIHPIMNPDTNVPFKPPLSFLERLVSTLIWGIFYLHRDWVFYPNEDETIKKIFGNESKPLRQLIGNMDMLFTNVNPIFHDIRALAPTTIQFGGGTHVTAPKELPEDLKQFLDSSRNGVIYFSLGTNVKSNALDEHILKILLETFSELPYNVLWKFEDEHLPNKPENVIIRKWVPQTDILGHPNTILFITQCGLQSMEEAIMSHVPMVGLPFFGDQPKNSVIMEKKGFGRTVIPKTMKKEELKDAIQDVLTDQRYKEKIIETANLLADHEISGLEKAVWWTEYVIRNKGASYLKSTHSRIPIYQYFLLDVIAFVALVLIIAVLVTIKFFSFLFRKRDEQRKKD